MTSLHPQATAKPDSTAIPVQLSATAFEHLLLPPLSLPKREPQCKLGSHRPFTSLLKGLYTGMPGKALPIAKGPRGKAELHYTGIFNLFACWAADGSLERAFIAAVNHLADTQKVDLSLLHGDGSNTVANKGGRHWLQRPQTPEGRESDCAGGQPRLWLVAPEGGAGQ
jgi:hypothetical protein